MVWLKHVKYVGRNFTPRSLDSVRPTGSLQRNTPSTVPGGSTTWICPCWKERLRAVKVKGYTSGKKSISSIKAGNGIATTEALSLEAEGHH